WPTAGGRVTNSGVGSADQSDMCCMTVEVLAASVVDRRRGRVGMTFGELHLPQWDAGVEGGASRRHLIRGWPESRWTRARANVRQRPLRSPHESPDMRTWTIHDDPTLRVAAGARVSAGCRGWGG